MATIDTLSEQIKRIIGSRTHDSDIDLRDVKLSVKQVLSDTIRVRYFISKQDDVEEIDGQLISRFTSHTVLKDATTGEFYTMSPCDVMNMPYGGAVVHVGPLKNHRESWKQVNYGFNSLYSGSLAQNLEGNAGFFMEGNKIFFVNSNNFEVGDELLIKILAGVDNLNKDQDFHIPADMEKIIVEYVLQLYGVWRPTDELNDGRDQQ